MKPLVLMPYYIQWHYSIALINIIAITKNLVWFLWHFFSIGILSRTLFLPWQKIQEDKPHTTDLGPILSTIIINILMRIAGAIIRIFMIAMGLFAIVVIVAGSLLFTAFWLALPFCIIFTFVIGIVLLFKPA